MRERIVGMLIRSVGPGIVAAGIFGIFYVGKIESVIQVLSCIGLGMIIVIGTIVTLAIWKYYETE